MGTEIIDNGETRAVLTTKQNGNLWLPFLSCSPLPAWGEGWGEGIRPLQPPCPSTIPVPGNSALTLRSLIKVRVFQQIHQVR